MQAGSAANQIPDQAVMRGTMRTLRNEVRDQVEHAIRRIADGVARSFDVSIDVEIPRGNAVTANTAGGTRSGRRGGHRGRFAAAPRPGPGDDRRGFRLVPRNTGPAPSSGSATARRDNGRELHNGNYDFNDAILPAAASYLASVAKQALA